MSQHGSNGIREELLAAADLSDRGYQVFAPIVGYAGGCDLVAVCRSSGQAIRIEVKRCVFSAPRADGSGMSYSNKPHPSRAGRYDVVAYVHVRDSNRVEYVPPLAEVAAKAA